MMWDRWVIVCMSVCQFICLSVCLCICFVDFNCYVAVKKFHHFWRVIRICFCKVIKHQHINLIQNHFKDVKWILLDVKNANIQPIKDATKKILVEKKQNFISEKTIKTVLRNILVVRYNKHTNKRIYKHK